MGLWRVLGVYEEFCGDGGCTEVNVDELGEVVDLR